jgi:hypothetical protein
MDSEVNHLLFRLPQVIVMFLHADIAVSARVFSHVFGDGSRLYQESCEVLYLLTA